MKLTKQTKAMFTLVEVMIVIAIIGLIAGMGIPKFNAYRESAFAAQRSANAERVVTSVESYVASRRLKKSECKAGAAAVSNAFDGQAGSTSDKVGNNDAGIFEMIKGGAAGLEVDGEPMTLPSSLQTDTYVGNWIPYSTSTTFSDDYTGIKNEN